MHFFTPEGNFKHGLYARYLLPPEQVQAIMDEEIVGMKEETDGFEILLDKLVERLEEPGLSDRAVLALGEAHLMSTARIQELFDFEKEELDGLSPEDAQALQTYQEFCNVYALPGSSEPTLENVCFWVDDDDPDGAVKDERLMRRIAADRLILRNILRVAQKTSDPLAYANLVQKYGRHCLGLCKLLRKARPASGRIEAWVRKEFDAFVASIDEYMRKQPPIMVPGWTGPIPPPGPTPTN
jgi:hypothetical protein